MLLVMLIISVPWISSCQVQTRPTDPDRGPSVAASVEKTEVAGIRNFSRVDHTTGFGGATHPAAMTGLKNDGFASVINLRLASEKGVDIDAGRNAAQAAGLKYIHMPFDAASLDPKLVDNFLAAVGDPANQPVYVHCGSATRVAALWMIKRVLEDGWEIDEAGEEAGVIASKPDVAVGIATRYFQSQGR
jgi:uncharacterized protein (TIGR01244 family)